MNHLTALTRAIDQSPLDPLPYLALADAMEESFASPLACARYRELGEILSRPMPFVLYETSCWAAFNSLREVGIPVARKMEVRISDRVNFRPRYDRYVPDYGGFTAYGRFDYFLNELATIPTMPGGFYELSRQDTDVVVEGLGSHSNLFEMARFILHAHPANFMVFIGEPL